MPTALAIAAHPDDIEFAMAGTLLLLARHGWAIHYFNLSSGNLGSTTMSPAKTAQVRHREARAAAASLGATWHAPICRDMEIFYDDWTLRSVASVVRLVQPQVVLTHALADYMEDHMNTARLAVSATFAREMAGYRVPGGRKPYRGHVALYHASPHGLVDGLRREVPPHAYVDTTEVHARKREALALHASQREWLDATQGMSSYLLALDRASEELGRQARRAVAHAESWRRHAHLGFAPEEFNPLQEVLGTGYLSAEAL